MFKSLLLFSCFAMMWSRLLLFRCNVVHIGPQNHMFVFSKPNILEILFILIFFQQVFFYPYHVHGFQLLFHNVLSFVYLKKFHLQLIQLLVLGLQHLLGLDFMRLQLIPQSLQMSCITYWHFSVNSSFSTSCCCCIWLLTPQSSSFPCLFCNVLCVRTFQLLLDVLLFFNSKIQKSMESKIPLLDVFVDGITLL
jgi:hypothetical protein